MESQGRGFFTAPAWFSGTPAESKTPGAGPKKDSYAEVKHLPDRPEPVRDLPAALICLVYRGCLNPI
jgi:hypothetical protein